MNWQKSHKDTLAADLAADAIRLLDIRPTSSGPVVSFFASQQVAEGTPETLPDRQIAALRELLQVHRVKTRRVVASLPTSLVVTRSVQIDRSKMSPVEDQIRATLQNCLPFDCKDLLFDYWPTGAAASSSRGEELLVVATQASVVHKYLAGLDKLGLTCVHLDVAPCAVATLLQRSAAQPDAIIGTVALTVGTGFFAIVENGRVLFWRPFDLSGAAASGSQKGVQISGLATNLDRVGDEISKCVSHMVGSMNVDTLVEMVLYGQGSDDLVVTEYLKNRFHVPVRSPSPFDVFDAAGMSSGMRDTVDHKVTTQYFAAVGLALQCAGAPLQGANANG